MVQKDFRPNSVSLIPHFFVVTRVKPLKDRSCARFLCLDYQDDDKLQFTNLVSSVTQIYWILKNLL